MDLKNESTEKKSFDLLNNNPSSLIGQQMGKGAGLMTTNLIAGLNSTYSNTEKIKKSITSIRENAFGEHKNDKGLKI